MRYLETLIMQFRVETVRSNFGGILHLGLEIIKAEDQPNEILLKRLNWIKDNTTEMLHTNYFIIVNTLARHMHQGLDSPIEIKIGRGRTMEMSLGELISELEDAHININEVVREVAKKYSLDIPFKSTGFQTDIPDMEALMKKPKEG